ncbi:MAG: MerR family transcriptional regulator [Ignavibacteria bacterium]|nr:MAG: MerR family transcriptional regulator [Ignavibacteria bacterium]KAF0162079.1 MAG: MerR family transcriptional regulator [Ignavibacteria bacterium]
MKDFGLKKLYYSISEVSRLTGLEQYILRYWETEFEQLKPGKNRAGNRIYTNKDIKLIIQIKQLLREEKYTIEGAKKILVELNFENIVNAAEETGEEKKKIVPPQKTMKKDLEDIKNFLLFIHSSM